MTPLRTSWFHKCSQRDPWWSCQSQLFQCKLLPLFARSVRDPCCRPGCHGAQDPASTRRCWLRGLCLSGCPSGARGSDASLCRGLPRLRLSCRRDTLVRWSSDRESRILRKNGHGLQMWCHMYFKVFKTFLLFTHFKINQPPPNILYSHRRKLTNLTINFNKSPAFFYLTKLSKQIRTSTNLIHDAHYT